MTEATNVELLMDAVRSRITSFQFNFQDERELQDGIEQVLSGSVVPCEREFELSKSHRIDFLYAKEVGVEVKIKGSPTEVKRQLLAYADYDVIKALVLVTTKNTLAAMPQSVRNKPLRVVVLGGRGL